MTLNLHALAVEVVNDSPVADLDVMADDLLERIPHPEWTPSHSHNDGLRIASKAILRDLWREAKRLHEDTA